MMHPSPHIIIIGANFAGLAAAKAMANSARVTLIDPSPFVEFLPNIHELISGHKAPGQLRLDRGKLIEKLGHSWIQDRVVALHPEENRLELSDGRQLDYNACILTVGGENNFHGVAGAPEYAYPFKSVEDCHRIGQRFQALKLARQPFSVVIVGGGSEGVEALGELLRNQREAGEMQIHLVEGADRLLPELPAKTSQEIERICQEQPVQFHFQTRIETVSKTAVSLSNGQKISSDLTIWTGGIQPPDLLAASGLSADAKAWATVRPSLQSAAYDNLFVAGDAATLPRADSKQAYFAMESGELAGENALRWLAGRPVRKFRTLERPYLYSLGELSCFMIWGDFVLVGEPLSILKEGIYQKSMLDLQNPGLCEWGPALLDRTVPAVIADASKRLAAFWDNPLEYLFKPGVKVL